MNTYFLIAFFSLFCTLFSPSALAEPAKAEKTEENSSNLNYIKGRQLYLDGKYEEALPFFQEAARSDPENPFINHQLSEIFLRLSQYEKAEIYCAKAVEQEPNNVEYLTTMGGIYAALKKYPEAKKQYSRIAVLQPENPKTSLLLGILEAESGNTEGGIQILSKAIDTNGENVMAYFYRAKLYLEAEQVEKAKADLNKCIAVRPIFVEAGTALGLLHERLGENEEAIKVYSKIQDSGAFKKRLAQLYLQKNDFQKALDELLVYEKVEPDDYTARVKIGLIYFEQKKLDLARDKFLAILKEQNDADNVRFYLGAVYEDAKEYPKAIAEFKKVTKDSSFYKEATLHTAFILRDQNKIDEGIGFSKKALAGSPKIIEFYDMYASFYEQ